MATKTSTTTDYYTAKAGRIAIFNGDNYPDFRRTCQAALIIVSAWNFIDGQEDPVTARTADAVKRRAEGIKLIFNSLGETYQESITDQMAAQNPRLMWEEIAKYDRARDDGYVGEIHKQFRTTAWDPNKMTIREFVHELEWHKITLQGSTEPLTEQDLR
jgi:hypothetical protein